MLSTYARHVAAIKSGAVDRSTVAGLRKLFNASERASRGWSISRTAAVCSYDELEALSKLLDDTRPLIVGELAETGKALLTNRRYAKQLDSMSGIISDLTEFRLVGFEPVGRELEKYTPVYRAYDSAGRSFPYTNLPWQAGGRGPQIMSPNYW